MSIHIGQPRPTNLPTTTEVNQQAQIAKDNKVGTVKTTSTGAVDVLGTLGGASADTGEVAQSLLDGAPASVNAEIFAGLAADVNLESLRGASGAGDLEGGALAQTGLPTPNALLRIGAAFPELSGLFDGLTLDASQSAALGYTLELGSTLATPPELNFKADLPGLTPLVSDLSGYFETVDTEHRLAQGEVVIPSDKVVAFESRATSILGAMQNADISTLVFLVMQECSRDTDRDLRQLMSEMKINNLTKDAMRKYQGWLQGVKAAWKKAALDEYRKRVSEGTSPPGESFEDFCNGLQMTLPTQSFAPNYNPGAQPNASGESATLPDPDSLSFDFSNYKSDAQIREETEAINAQMDAAAASGLGDVPPLDPKKAIEWAKQFGISPTDINQFWTFYMSHGGPEQLGDFQAWLAKGPSDNPLDGPGLTLGSGTEMVPENQAKIEAFVGRVAELGAAKKAQAQQDIDALKLSEQDIKNWPNLSKEQREAKLKELINGPDGKVLLDALGASSADEAVKKLYGLVDDIALLQLKMAHQKTEGMDNTGPQLELDAKIKEMSGILAKCSPSLKAGISLIVETRCNELATHFSDAANANRWRSCGGTDISGKSAEAGSGDVAAYDVKMDGFGTQGSTYVDPEALKQTAALMVGFGKDGLAGVPGSASACGAAANDIADQIAKKGGDPAPAAAESQFAADWKNDRAARAQAGEPDLFASVASEGGENVGMAQMMGTVDGGDAPAFQFGSTANPYDTTTTYKGMNLDQLDAELEKSRGEQDALGSVSDDMSTRLQLLMGAKTNLTQMISNLMDKLGKTRDAVIANLK